MENAARRRKGKGKKQNISWCGCGNGRTMGFFNMHYKFIIDYMTDYDLAWLRAFFPVIHARQAGTGRWFVLVEVG